MIFNFSLQINGYFLLFKTSFFILSASESQIEGHKLSIENGFLIYEFVAVFCFELKQNFEQKNQKKQKLKVKIRFKWGTWS